MNEFNLFLTIFGIDSIMIIFIFERELRRYFKERKK